MEIRFSESYAAFAARVALWSRICDAATDRDLIPQLTRANGAQVRFTLPGASVAEHDRVIRALLTLDPDATVRTARAVYEGLADFEKQRGKV